MSRPSHTSPPLTVQPVYLAASAVNNLVRVLPAGTAYFIGIVLITMFTGQLVHHQGSLARAALPYVVHLRWGWHRVERAMERGKVSLDALFDRRPPARQHSVCPGGQRLLPSGSAGGEGQHRRRSDDGGRGAGSAGWPGGPDSLGYFL